MRKYVTIADMRDLPSYQNINARLIYLHCAMAMEVKSRTFVRSIRQLAADLDMTERQVRTAIDALERDGLIKTDKVEQVVTRKVTQMVTQMVTQLSIMSVSDLQHVTDTHNDTHNDTHKNNLKNNNNSLSSARVAWADMREVVKKALDVDAATAAAMVDTFKERQAMKGKIWKDEGDLKAHLVAFAEKRLASLPRQRQTARESDQQARAAEMQRAKEQQENQERKAKDWEEVQTAWRWWKEAERKAERTESPDERAKLQQLSATHQEAYEKLRAEWINKYKPQKIE